MKRGVSLFLCLFFILNHCGCGGRPPKIARLKEDSVILAFGDSLTSGSGSSKKNSYPSLLEQMTGYKVINSGVPGELTNAGVTRLPSLLEKYKPSLVILCHGGNDILKNIAEEQTIRNLNRMIEAIKNKGIDVILIGVPNPGLRLKTASFYRGIAKRYNIPFDGNTIAEILSIPSLKSDYAHPNSKGYKKLAEAVARLVRQSQTL